MRALYRLRQFSNALSATPGEEDLELARSILTPPQLALFLQLQPGEQAHSLAVLKKIRAMGTDGLGEPCADLQVAALLHDVGKIRFPLRLWERVVIVLGKVLTPGQARSWGLAQPPGGWRRPFVVSGQHPIWGAELAAAAGASPLAVDLIRRHQNHSLSEPVSIEEKYLQILQSVDEDS